MEMDRRDFIQSAGLGLAASAIMPGAAIAGSKVKGGTIKGGGGLFYTKDSPGRWSKKLRVTYQVLS